MADPLKRQGGHLRDYWGKFARQLRRLGLVECEEQRPSGYSYYLRGTGGKVASGNAYLVGDAAGLATVDMCEGIGPAIRSGLLAAKAIITGADYSLDTIDRQSGHGLVSNMLERKFVGKTGEDSYLVTAGRAA